MATETKLLLMSADNHIVEPPDLWTKNIESKFKDRAPRLIVGDEFDWWCVEGGQSLGSIGNTTNAGARFRTDRPDEIPAEGRWESVLPGAYDPNEAIKDMDIDGVYGGAIFPTMCVGGMWRMDDPVLFSAICRTYNDWIADFCHSYPDRLKGVAMINLDDVAEGVKELRRAHDLGLTSSFITIYPKHGRQYHRDEYEPFWRASEEMGMPICLHSGTNRDFLPMNLYDPADENEPLGVIYATNDYWVRRSVTSMILSGVFERYPELKVVSVENEAGWAAQWLYKMDLLQRDRGMMWPRFKNDMTPSDFFHRNVFVTFQEDYVAVSGREHIGLGNLLWGSDYPHTEGTWPDSRRIIGEVFAGTTQEELRIMTHDNTAKVFGFTPQLA
jgi:predicted TIM-barrel fold metal-dependent hydrolase